MAARAASLMREHGHTILVLASLLATGCGVQQQAAEKLIDPELHERGVLVERQSSRRDLGLGPYRVEGLQVHEERFDGTGPLAPDAEGRTRPTQQWRLQFAMLGGETPWDVQCIGQRRQPPDHDLAAEADELRDEVAVRCQLSGGGQHWLLRIDGSLAANLNGTLESVGLPDTKQKVVEVVMWHRLWNISRRRLPASLALIRADGETEAALILDAPERAWLAPELDAAARELAMASMLALRLLPLGFDV